MKIFLDDERSPAACSGRFIYDVRSNKEILFPYSSYSWTVVKNYAEFENLLNHVDISEVTTISLDHDLCDQHYTGMTIDHSVGYYDRLSYGTIKSGLDCALLLREVIAKSTKSCNAQILIHTMNYLALEQMANILRNNL